MNNQYYSCALNFFGWEEEGGGGGLGWALISQLLNVNLLLNHLLLPLGWALIRGGRGR